MRAVCTDDLNNNIYSVYQCCGSPVDNTTTTPDGWTVYDRAILCFYSFFPSGSCVCLWYVVQSDKGKLLFSPITEFKTTVCLPSPICCDKEPQLLWAGGLLWKHLCVSLKRSRLPISRRCINSPHRYQKPGRDTAASQLHHIYGYTWYDRWRITVGWRSRWRVAFILSCSPVFLCSPVSHQPR